MTTRLRQAILAPGKRWKVFLTSLQKRKKVLSSWQKLDENVAKDLSQVLLRSLLCGITKGRMHVPLPPNGIRLKDGTRLVRPRNLKLIEQSVAIWLPYLPDWRMLRVEEIMLRFLR